MKRRIAGVLAVVSLAAGIRVASAESLDAQASPGELSPEEESQLLKDAERTVRLADLVVDAEPGEFPQSSPRAEFHVNESLKGSVGSDKPLTVDLTKAPVGLWPREGERRILCLAPDGSGGYELSAYHASILPSSDRARETIRALVQGLPPDTENEKKKRAEAVASKGPRPPVGPHAEHIARAETILVGVLSNIEREGGAGAEGVFRLDEKNGALLGYDGYRAPITVRFPPPAEEALDEEAPRAGRYMLFLKGNTIGPGFESVHRIPLTDAAAEADLRREVRREIDPARGRLTAVQSTLAEWQEAWNARDLGRCVKCYSVDNPSRKLYEAGGAGRRDLERQIKKFASTVMVSLQQVHATEEREGGRVEVETTVLIELTVSGVQDRRTVKMKFVREGGEWLILDEGL